MTTQNEKENADIIKETAMVAAVALKETATAERADAAALIVKAAAEAVLKLQKTAEDAVLKLNESVKRSLENAEAQVLTQYQLFKSILNSITSGIYVIDNSGKIVFYNNELVALLGPQKIGERLEERSKDYGMFLPDQQTIWPIDQLPLIRVMTIGNPNGGIMYIRNKSKPEGIWITNYASPLKSEDGEMIGAIAVLKEIVNASTQGMPAFGIDVPPIPM